MNQPCTNHSSYSEQMDAAMSGKALRYNSGKPQLSIITEANYALAGLAEVLEYGANKYARSNWLKGLTDVNCIDSLLRHLVKYQSGELIDPESGCHHLDHVLANALFLAHHHNGKNTDG